MITKLEFLNTACQYEDTIKTIERFYGYTNNAMVIDVYKDPSSWSGQLVFDAVTDQVLFAGLYDYVNNRAYCLVAPWHVLHDEKAWEDVRYIDLVTKEDFLNKMFSLVNDDFDYDTRIEIPLNLPDEELLVLFKMAHEHDMTFNEFVEHVLESEINRLSALNEQFTNV